MNQVDSRKMQVREPQIGRTFRTSYKHNFALSNARFRTFCFRPEQLQSMAWLVVFLLDWTRDTSIGGPVYEGTGNL
uniref:Uncharacterized protein n=2 Tax=Picea TaxID=3328 RepID=A0A101LXP7_PICGL|nr:hypothetical protein ABT39_MTgene5461 [Picea glauca]QHR91523.1 hypothetical protein Q903MT_gene5558 [Picea sitchensis]